METKQPRKIMSDRICQACRNYSSAAATYGMPCAVQPMGPVGGECEDFETRHSAIAPQNITRINVDERAFFAELRSMPGANIESIEAAERYARSPLSQAALAEANARQLIRFGSDLISESEQLAEPSESSVSLGDFDLSDALSYALSHRRVNVSCTSREQAQHMAKASLKVKRSFPYGCYPSLVRIDMSGQSSSVRFDQRGIVTRLRARVAEILHKLANAIG